MAIRTYIRTLFNDIFKENFIVKVFVNFYYSFFSKVSKTIKFNPNIPTILKEEKKSVFFQSVTGDKIDCK